MIRISASEERLYIRISDDGRGMTDEKLKELNEKLRRLDVETDVPEKEEEKKPARGGIAVVNVNRRIKLLFGEEYGIHVYSKEGIGTDVIVELPLVRDGDRQGDLERDGEQLLDDLEFQMFAGEIVGLVARNRKGQKEMVDLICRNDPISLGSVWYDGNVVNSYAYSSGESNKVALIEQKSHLVQGLSVVDNLFILREGFRKYFINEQVIFSQAVRFFEEKGLKVDLEKRPDRA